MTGTERFDAGYDLPAPSDAHIRRLADQLGLELSDATFAVMAEGVRGSVTALRGLRHLAPAEPPTRHPRLPGRRPTPDENPYNGWSWRCEVAGAGEGPLAGLTVSVKESVCVAGVPMSNGSALVDGHIPRHDATVVTRLLDAGATITGRATSENFGLSSGSNTSSAGAVVNPADPERSVGGSSSGCAALVASGACDASVGTDQGGSVRLPAALCGIVGLKPTYGRVPYTGVLSIETSLDHVGFFARDVDTVRRMLDATAGPDGLDARRCPPQPDPLHREPGREGPWRIAVLREGWEAVSSTAPVRRRLDEVADALRDAGHEVDEVSVPEHLPAGLVPTPIYAEGITTQLLGSGGASRGAKGFHPEDELVATLRAIKAQPDLLPDTGKLFALVGAHLGEAHLGRYYWRAQNLALGLRRRYDEALAGYDALLMPTCAPSPVAQPMPVEPGPAAVFEAAFGYHVNAAVFNLTGHPAISVPAGLIDELPFGVMLVGAHDDDEALCAMASVVVGAAPEGGS